MYRACQNKCWPPRNHWHNFLVWSPPTEPNQGVWLLLRFWAFCILIQLQRCSPWSLPFPVPSSALGGEGRGGWVWGGGLGGCYQCASGWLLTDREGRLQWIRRAPPRNPGIFHFQPPSTKPLRCTAEVNKQVHREEEIGFFKGETRPKVEVWQGRVTTRLSPTTIYSCLLGGRRTGRLVNKVWFIHL